MKAKRALLLITVFVGGMVSLGTELTAARLLDPFFGNSLIIWAVLIGMVLLYLTVGYYVGGIWADRKPYHRVLYQITAWAAFLIGLVPFVARPVLLWSVRGFAEYSAGILAGITREVVLELAVSLDIPVREEELELAELLGADEAFLTSTTKEVLPIRQVDETLLGDGKPGPITRKLLEAFRTYAHSYRER